MNKDKEIQAFSNFIAQEAKAKGKDPKAYAKELGEEGLKEAYKRFQASQKKQAQKALHGAKLNYFKSLKNQCAEDEEVVYYKKGGSVGCGCKKKDTGGPITKDNPSWKTKFENRKKNYPNPTEGGEKKYDPKTKKYVPVTEEDRKKWKKNLDDARKGEGEGTPERKCGGKVKKNEDGSKIKKNCGGSAIAKFKMHRQGGFLNRI